MKANKTDRPSRKHKKDFYEEIPYLDKKEIDN